MMILLASQIFLLSCRKIANWQNIKDKLNPICDVAYGNEEIQKLDIYAPKLASKLPVLIDIHGGGWVAGSKNARSIPAEVIMSYGIIGYRLIMVLLLNIAWKR